MAGTRTRLRDYLRRSRGSTKRFEARLERAAPDHPTPIRPRPAPTMEPDAGEGETRYQRNSANLPHGIEGFSGLGDEADITVDLTEVAAEPEAEQRP